MLIQVFSFKYIHYVKKASCQMNKQVMINEILVTEWFLQMLLQGG